MLFTIYVSSDSMLHAISMTSEWDQQQLSLLNRDHTMLFTVYVSSDTKLHAISMTS